MTWQAACARRLSTQTITMVEGAACKTECVDAANRDAMMEEMLWRRSTSHHVHAVSHGSAVACCGALLVAVASQHADLSRSHRPQHQDGASTSENGSCSDAYHAQWIRNVNSPRHGRMWKRPPW